MNQNNQMLKTFTLQTEISFYFCQQYQRTEWIHPKYQQLNTILVSLETVQMEPKDFYYAYGVESN